MTGAGGTEAAGDLRCAAQMRAAGADPIGTAGSYDGYLLVEWSRPWPRDLAEIPELAPVRAALDNHRRRTGATIRLQGLVPDAADRRRVVLHRRDGGPFAAYTRSEWDASAPASLAADGARPPTEPVEVGRRLGRAAAALLAGEPGTSTAYNRDVLVCTHGRRDRCCGSWGTELWQELSTLDLGDDVRLWRTSHTGGHRYAATMVVLPEGTAWGFADAGSAMRVLRRDGPVTEVLAGYRGCAGMPSPAVQSLERAVLAEVGWSLLDTPRTGEDLGAGRVALTTYPEGAAQRWEATVTAGRTLAVPECGALPAGAGKTSVEQVVTEITRPA